MQKILACKAAVSKEEKPCRSAYFGAKSRISQKDFIKKFKKGVDKKENIGII